MIFCNHKLLSVSELWLRIIIGLADPCNWSFGHFNHHYISYGQEWLASQTYPFRTRKYRTDFALVPSQWLGLTISCSGLNRMIRRLGETLQVKQWQIVLLRRAYYLGAVKWFTWKRNRYFRNRLWSRLEELSVKKLRTAKVIAPTLFTCQEIRPKCTSSLSSYSWALQISLLFIFQFPVTAHPLYTLTNILTRD